MRRGFSLIMAVVFIIVIATLGAFALKYSSTTRKSSGDVYLKQQAEFLATSATEYAILALQSHNNYPLTFAGLPATFTSSSGVCLSNINMTYPTQSDPLFNIQIRYHYFGDMCNNSSLNLKSTTAPELWSIRNIRNTVLVTVVVTSSPNVVTEPIRYVRRTLQRPYFNP